MRRDKPLIYSATEGNFCIWPFVLRCSRHRIGRYPHTLKNGRRDQ